MNVFFATERTLVAYIYSPLTSRSLTQSGSSAIFRHQKAMASSGGPKSAASVLLLLNLVLYFVVTVMAAWVVNHGIERSHETGKS